MRYYIIFVMSLKKPLKLRQNDGETSCSVRSATWVVTEIVIDRVRGCMGQEIVSRIHRPVVEQEIWRIRTNQELGEL